MNADQLLHVLREDFGENEEELGKKRKVAELRNMLNSKLLKLS
jgi:hypothetical protein